MADVLTTLPVGNKYATLKSYLAKKYVESDEKKLERLFRESILGGRLSSELYTEMKRCGNAQVQIAVAIDD